MKTGSRIRLAREAKGWSREELATRCGMSSRTLEKIEQGVVEEPKLVDVAAIAAAMGKTCSDFVPNDEPEPPAPGRGRPVQPAEEEPEPPTKPVKKTKGGKK